MQYSNFEVYRRRGRGWQLLGVYSAPSERRAVADCQYVNGGHRFGVRASGSVDSIVAVTLASEPML